MYNNIATAAKIVVSFRWITRDWSNIGRLQPSFINTFCHNGRIKSGKKYQCQKNGRRQTDYFSLCLVKYTNLLDMIVTFCFRAQKHFCPNWMHRPFSTATFSCSLFRWATHTDTHTRYSSFSLSVRLFSLCSAGWLYALFFSSIDRRVSNSICLLLTTQFKSRCDLFVQSRSVHMHTHSQKPKIL